jgi:hypothetical protein
MELQLATRNLAINLFWNPTRTAKHFCGMRIWRHFVLRKQRCQKWSNGGTPVSHTRLNSLERAKRQRTLQIQVGLFFRTY